MQYCINIIKSNQIKSNQIKSGIIYFKQHFLKIFLIALLSFIALFSISCNNAYAPLGYDIPTTSGDPFGAEHFYGFFSGGNFTRVKLEVTPETAKNISEAKIIFPSIYSNRLEVETFYEGGKKYIFTNYIGSSVEISGYNISVEAPYSTIKDAPYYNTGIFYNARVDNGNVKSYIKYQDIPSGITVEYIVAIITNGMGIRATYTGILENHSPIE